MRLRQFREVTNPHNYIDFETDLGRHLCAAVIVIECPACGQHRALPRKAEVDFKCRRCGKNFPDEP
jgi:transposase-like protein